MHQTEYEVPDIFYDGYVEWYNMGELQSSLDYLMTVTIPS